MGNVWPAASSSVLVPSPCFEKASLTLVPLLRGSPAFLLYLVRLMSNLPSLFLLRAGSLPVQEQRASVRSASEPTQHEAAVHVHVKSDARSSLRGKGFGPASVTDSGLRPDLIFASLYA